MAVDIGRVMTVEIAGEFGYSQALRGLALNKNQPTDNMSNLALKLSTKDYGHNKFLEGIYLWIFVNGSRDFWQEADTYRIASKNSQSTMHTLLQTQLTQEHFTEDIPESYLSYIQETINKKNLRRAKKLLPEGFKQMRLWIINYKTLRNIIIQREHHKLIEWQIFIHSVLTQIQHPELLPGNIVELAKKIEDFKNA